MTTLFLTFLAAAGLLLTACSQQLSAKNTPALVQNTLKARYPDAQEVEWEKKQDFFEAEFTRKGQKYSVVIDGAGHITRIKQDIAAAELPTAVAAALRNNHPDFTVEDAEEIEQGGQVYYQVELEKDLRERQLVFGPDGQIATNLNYWD